MLAIIIKTCGYLYLLYLEGKCNSGKIVSKSSDNRL